jgi:hypothetical protein
MGAARVPLAGHTLSGNRIASAGIGVVMSAQAHDRPAGTDLARPKKWMLWTGRVLSLLPALLILFSAGMKLAHAPQFIAQWTGKFGYTEGSATTIGVIEVACVVLYLVPRTSVLGAVLLTGYLGGAVATHVRIGDPSFVTPLLLGVLAWAGLYLREGRLRALLPLRSR